MNKPPFFPDLNNEQIDSKILLTTFFNEFAQALILSVTTTNINSPKEQVTIKFDWIIFFNLLITCCVQHPATAELSLLRNEKLINALGIFALVRSDINELRHKVIFDRFNTEVTRIIVYLENDKQDKDLIKALKYYQSHIGTCKVYSDSYMREKIVKNEVEA